MASTPIKRFTKLSVVSFSDAWPPAAPQRLLALQVAGAEHEIKAFPDGHLALQLAGAAAEIHFQRIRPLCAGDAFLTVTWDSDAGRCYIDHVALQSLHAARSEVFEFTPSSTQSGSNAAQAAAVESAETFIAAWQKEATSGTTRDAEWFAATARKAINFGLPTLAIDIVERSSATFPDNTELLYLNAMAFAKSGSLTSASTKVNKLLSMVPPTDARYFEALSLAGRIEKDTWAMLRDDGRRARAGEKARALYGEAYRMSRDYFPGINAATMSYLTGAVKEAQQIAKEVREICRKAEAGARSTDHWLHATVGEAHALLGEFGEAKQRYTEAHKLAGKSYGDIASMRRQLTLLAQTIPQLGDTLKALAIPGVVAFTGHMIDDDGREEPRFPHGAERDVEQVIARELERLSAGFGFTSAACGGDILFAEQMLKRGGELTIVLPFRREDFVATSVAHAGAGWIKRFEDVLARATNVTCAIEENYFGDDCLFYYAGELIQGMALLRGQQLQADTTLLAVLDPTTESKIGGALATVERWQAQGRQASLIDLRPIRDARSAASSDTAPVQADKDARPELGLDARFWSRRQIKTILFADMVGFSKLAEEHAPAFTVAFLGAIAKQIAASSPKPEFVNTWGDGLFIVFDDLLAASKFALDLRDAIVTTDWPAAGLPQGIGIRIGMHTGPVFPALDPVIEKNNFFGSHVNRAARIEPIAAPGSVYISEQAASMLAAIGTNAFACDYMGTMALAKQFGASRMYRLRRSFEIE